MFVSVFWCWYLCNCLWTMSVCVAESVGERDYWISNGMFLCCWWSCKEDLKPTWEKNATVKSSLNFLGKQSALDPTIKHIILCGSIFEINQHVPAEPISRLSLSNKPLNIAKNVTSGSIAVQTRKCHEYTSQSTIINS